MGKKYIYLATIVLLLFWLATSCTKKPPPLPTILSPDMSAIVGGAAWAETILKVTNSNGVDTISGLRASDSSTIVLLFPNGQNSGDTLKIGSINTIEYIKSSITYDAINGSIIITSSANNTLKGTFAATVEDFNSSTKISITGGTFTAKF